MTPVRILGCGGRNLNPYKVWEWLTYNLMDHLTIHVGGPVRITAVIEGNQTGGDEGFGYFAIASGLPHFQCTADWITHGATAGSIRNRQMVLAFRPDIVIAFPGYVGTPNMIKIANSFGIPVLTVAGNFR